MGCCEHDPGIDVLAFFREVSNGRSPAGSCLGPEITMSLWSWQVGQLERIFQGAPHSDLLWSGYVNVKSVGLEFQLCAAHWFDLVWYAGLAAFRDNRRDWAAQSGMLLTDLCLAAGWDHKEVANLITNMGARLT
jgi:hypothetical protein